MSDFDMNLVTSALEPAGPKTPILASAPRIELESDVMNGNYSNSQVTFQLPMLTSRAGLFALANSWVEIPYVIVVEGEEFVMDSQFLALKGGFASLVDGHQITIGTTPFSNIVSGSNIYNNYRRLIDNDLQYLARDAQLDAFGIDNSNSVSFVDNGVGETNNAYANDGLSKRMDNYSIPINVAENGSFLSDAQQSHAMFKFVSPSTLVDRRTSFMTRVLKKSTVHGVANNINGQFKTTYHILATIQLKDIDPIFAEDKIQLLHGLNLTLTLQIHTATVDLAFVANANKDGVVVDTANSRVTSQHGQCPFIIRPHNTTWAFAKTATNDATKYADNYAIKITSGIMEASGTKNAFGLNSCLFRACFIQLAPDMMKQYNSQSKSKRIAFNDLYINKHPSPLPAVDRFSGAINFYVTNSVTRPRFLLMHTRTVDGGTGQQFAGDSMLSPFSSSPMTCAPYVSFRNLQVEVGGVPIYHKTKDYSYEMFLDQIAKSGNKDDLGNYTGLISKEDWERGALGFYYFDLSRFYDGSADATSRSIEVRFQYASKRPIQITYILGHEKYVNIDTDSSIAMFV